MKKPTHLTCPACHAPVALERYECAAGEGIEGFVCPECDSILLCCNAYRAASAGNSGPTPQPAVHLAPSDSPSRLPSEPLALSRNEIE
jgi:transposase-like protein